MHIVPVEDIPKTVDLLPKDDLPKIFKICKQMEDVCIGKNGIGLSALQVGINWPLFIAKVGGLQSFRYFIDCNYSPIGDEKHFSLEGCLSLPNRFFRVERWNKVVVTGQELVVDNNGELNIKDIKEDTSEVVFQHEIDHHRLVLISDIGTEVFLRFEKSDNRG